MSDNLDRVWGKFHKERTNTLWDRFPGFYRSLVVETNDPLQIYRIRFRCPELHDSTLKPEKCPWAVPAPWLGGQGSGSWAHPCIGDIIWITWEKNHPYGPIWTGFATPTRRKFYPLESIFGQTPLPVKLDGTSDKRPEDFQKTYLPNDGRPMQHGWRDRYGNFELNSSTGFFPVEHDIKSTDQGSDAIAKNNFSKKTSLPKVNDPDRKYLLRCTKYGNMVIQSDVGYHWQKPKKEGGDPLGEFVGDFVKDSEFEIKRTFYLQKLANENVPTSVDGDQRRYEIRTRAGHKFEMRDVGWAQLDGGRSGCNKVSKTKSRKDEYGEPRILSKEIKIDERWTKLRTKGGHVIQLMDTGFHPEEDNFYKRLLLDEVGSDADKEKEAKWVERDSRQVRILTRWGTKFVLDDRGTDPRKAEIEEKPRANGWLLKTRRSWQNEPTKPRGFGFEANDKDELDTTRWYTPKSKVIEMNDKEDYTLICSDTKSDLSREWMGLKENEFATKIAMTEKPEEDTYHLKLDKHNGYLRLKTAAGGDNERRPEPQSFGFSDTGLNQGLEARDGRFGSDGAWTELVDIEHRGMWFSKNENMGVWRSKQGKDQYIMINDGNNSVLIRNNEQGPIQIFCGQDIQVIADRNISMKATGKIMFKAGQEIVFEAANKAHAVLNSTGWSQDVIHTAPGHITGTGVGIVDNPTPITKDKREPEDRGESLNDPKEISEEIIMGCNIKEEPNEDGEEDNI